MSISSMTTIAVAKRAAAPGGRRPEAGSRFEILGTSKPEGEDKGAGETSPALVPPSERKVTDLLDVVAAYVPTEVVALYVAFCGAAIGTLASGAASGGSSRLEWIGFWSFLVATPIVVWLLYAGKLRGLKLPLPLRPSQWPHWEMVAATIAFVAWAYALPGGVFAKGTTYSAPVAGFILLVVSTLIGLVAPIVKRG